MQKSVSAVIASPLGPLVIKGSEKGVQSIAYGAVSSKASSSIPPELRSAVWELRAYFQGKRLSHSLQFDLRGTMFQKKIWDRLRRIPAGHVTTYGDLARKAGFPGAARAVGSAMKKNPVPILVPCHRVLPSGATRENPGSYNSGPAKKKWLLAHEESFAGS